MLLSQGAFAPTANLENGLRAPRLGDGTIAIAMTSLFAS